MERNAHDFFPDFLAFCFPHIATEIDWNREVTFLDKEFQAITKDAAIGQRSVDKLIKVFKKEGTEVWVLVHIEIQGQKEVQFSERMYIYQYRLFDRYRVPVVSIAILIDANPHWAPHVYQSTLWGTELHFKFNVLKILDYQEKITLLEQSSNPFALVILAQLAAIALAKKQSHEQKLISKLSLTRLLFAKGWPQDRIYQLFRFIDWLILLPQNLMIDYDTAVHELSEKTHMTYITSIERLAMKRGRERGMLEGLEKGKLEGLEKGKLEGKLEGLKKGELKGQKEARLAIAKQLLLKGQTLDFVADITGLDRVALEALSGSLKH